MQIRSRITALAPAAALLAAGTCVVTLGSAPAGAAPLASDHIQGPSGRCVTASGQAPGAAVVLSPCSVSNKNQRWTLEANGTIELAGTAELLSADPTSKLVMLGGTVDGNSTWFGQADRTLVNIGLSADPQHQFVLDWLSHGQLLVDARRPGGPHADLQHYTLPHTIYAGSLLTNRPDSGGGGNTWALDTMVRRSSVTRLSDGSFQASIVDDGGFVTVFGNLTPNQGLDPGETLGDDSTGAIEGHWGFTFTTAAKPSASNMPGRVNGLGTVGSGSWYKLFFPAGTNDFGGSGAVSSGPLDWSWSYLLTDNCGQSETWLDADNDNSGQQTTGPNASDITAPAPSSCP
jgi:hypothetical protein